MNAATDARTMREALALLVTVAGQHGAGSSAAMPANLGRQVDAYLERQQAELTALRSCLQELAAEVATMASSAARLLDLGQMEVIEPSRGMVCQIGAMVDRVLPSVGMPRVRGDADAWFIPAHIEACIARVEASTEPHPATLDRDGASRPPVADAAPMPSAERPN